MASPSFGTRAILKPLNQPQLCLCVRVEWNASAEIFAHHCNAEEVELERDLKFFVGAQGVGGRHDTDNVPCDASSFSQVVS